MSVGGIAMHNHVGVDQLEPGDHVYVHTVGYAFTHHAIYDGNGYVIHRPCGATVKTGGDVQMPANNPVDDVLTSLRVQGSASVKQTTSPSFQARNPHASTTTPLGADSASSSATTDDPTAAVTMDSLTQASTSSATGAAQESAATGADGAMSGTVQPCPGNGCIRRVKIEEFAGPHDVRLYEYDLSVAKTTIAPAGTCSEYPRNIHRTAQELARWFLEHPDAFNKYDEKTWHCEHFATFCCTTWLGTADMDEARTAGKLTKEFLLGSSNSFGSQTEGRLASVRAASRVIISPVMLALDAVGAKLLQRKPGKQG